jgi:hypothetical protein
LKENLTPERGYKNKNLHDKLSYCRLIEFDDIAKIKIKIRKTRE